MKIHGLQKMTLLDFPGKIACTVFLGGCDFKCPFCHNGDLLGAEIPEFISEEEFFTFLEGRKGRLEGVAITGGEPLLRKDMPEFLARIKGLGFPIKLDTNGNHPDMLKKIVREGLVDYVAMDIKNSPERYGIAIGIENFDLSKVVESKDFLINDAGIDFEFRTTVVDELHDEESFEKIGPWIKGAKKYYLQNFVDRDTVPFAGLTSPGKEKLEIYKNIVAPYVGFADIRGV